METEEKKSAGSSPLKKRMRLFSTFSERRCCTIWYKRMDFPVLLGPIIAVILPSGSNEIISESSFRVAGYKNDKGTALVVHH
jgi:hypothetical protein